MHIITTRSDLRQHLASEKGMSIGLVPTMGALHAGHISLVKRSVRENDITVVTIFVNPTQFNDQQDLIKYPRDVDGDRSLLSASLSDSDLLFIPEADDIYSDEKPFTLDLGELDRIMEGKFRPGHFGGVVRVVRILLESVMPDRAYFGQKDFQQLVIISEMTRQLGLPVEIIPCPIVRESNGLAMSSRNTRLEKSVRQKAGLVCQTLKKYSVIHDQKSIEKVKQEIIDEIERSGLFRVEYFDIVDNRELRSVTPLTPVDPEREYFGCIALYAGDVRLIDNMAFSFPNSKG